MSNASYATASAQAVAVLVRERYGMPGPMRCALLNRGFNDIYRVESGGARWVLRISGWRERGLADVAGETAFLAHLDAAGVPVAAAVPAMDGALFTSIALPDGVRPVVLFRFAEGRLPGLDDAGDAGLQGMTLARLHDAADGFAGREAGRYRLDLDHLLHRQVAAVLALGLDAPEAVRALPALAERLGAVVAGMAGLSQTRCHGDCHGMNARIATAGPHAGEAVFFDFDDGGFGYLAYDLAVHLWAQISFGRRRHAVWHAFDAGYRTVRPMLPADERAIPVFVAIRHIWLMGEWASHTALWGREVLSAAWLEREMRFLLDWERERLSGGLF